MNKLKLLLIPMLCWLKLLFTLMLFCNVVAIGAYLHRMDADFIFYLNWVGCVYFGSYITSVIQKT